MKLFLTIAFSLLAAFAIAQPANNECIDVQAICDANVVSGTTANGTSNNAQDGIAPCFINEKTVWYNFTTGAAGGNISVNVTGINCSGAGNNLSGIVYEAGTPCDGTTYTVVSNCEAFSSTGFSLNANGLNPNTTYYIKISSGKDCTFDIQVAGPALATGVPTISIASNAGGTVCEQTPVTFTATTTNCTNPTVIWTINGVTAQSDASDTFVTSALENADNVQAELVCDCGGPILSNTEIMSTFANTVDAGPDHIITIGGSVVLQGSAGAGGGAIWTPGNTLSNPNTLTPVAAPTTTTQYVLSVVDVNGCLFVDSALVTVIDTITIPNTFTPNDDGVNDQWDILKLEKFENAKVTVYDRWGQEVFKTIGYPISRRWDGTRGGNKLPPTTYYYVIELDSSDKDTRIETGSVTIIY